MKELATALNKAQSVMTAARKDATNPHYGKGYSTLAAVFDAIKEPFAENGLCVSQPIEITEDGRMVVVTLLMHISGEHIKSRMLLPNLDVPQKMGAALSYYRRYSLMSIAGIPSADDDGNEASAAVTSRSSLVTASQVTSLNEALNKVPIYKTIILRRIREEFNGSSIKDLPSSLYAPVMQCAKEALIRSQKVEGCL